MPKITPEMKANLRKIKAQLPRGYAKNIYQRLNQRYSKNYIYSVANGHDWNKIIFNEMVLLKQEYQTNQEGLAKLIRDASDT